PHLRDRVRAQEAKAETRHGNRPIHRPSWRTAAAGARPAPQRGRTRRRDEGAMRARYGTYILQLALVAVLYLATGRVSLLLAELLGGVSALWLPAGVAAAAV